MFFLFSPLAKRINCATIKLHSKKGGNNVPCLGCLAHGRGFRRRSGGRGLWPACHSPTEGVAVGVMQISTLEIVKAVAYMATIGLVDLTFGAIEALSQRFSVAVYAALHS